MAIDVQDAALGAIVGLAVGDALGAPVEFLKPGSFPPITGYREGGILNLPAGCWTEDTALALCLAESLIACGGTDPVDQLRRYVRYWREGYQAPTGVCLDIGTTTRRSLEAFLRTGMAEAAPIVGLTPGNGSLVRVASVPIFFAGDPGRTFEEAAAMSRTTHAAPESVDACRYFAGLLSGAILGAPISALTSPMYEPVDGFWDSACLCPPIVAVAEGSFLAKESPAIRAGGGAVQCLEAALWAFAHGDSFPEVVLAAVNLGDDADTVGAVAGQLAGACYGLSGIPAEWQEELYRHHDIVRVAVNLMAAGTRAAFGLGPARPERFVPRRRTRGGRRVARGRPGSGGDTHLETFLRFVAALPREGPGDERLTTQLYGLLTDLPERPRAADMGSGSGAAALAIARAGARVTAVDRAPGLLQRLNERAAVERLANRVRTLQISMDAVPEDEGPFDLIWSEGAVYNIGFDAGLRAWRDLLAPGGYVVVSDLSWLVDDPPPEVQTFWRAAYPGMRTIAANAAACGAAGYCWIGSIRLPDAAWDAFYDAQRERCREWRTGGPTPDEAAVIAEVEDEMRIHATYRATYGYVFYLMQWPG
ncbi:MAG TPA: methyltransferase domain-containing protein [Methanoregulaceae archaeon]|nr:methyltransferase domain-containing protein [Methanoregulaceae archaeon]